MIKRGSIILVRINDDNFPLFGEIADIFKTKSNVSLLTPSCFSATIKYMFATYYDNHYQAYVINISDKYDAISFDSVQFFKVYTLVRKADDNSYISY